MKDLVDIIDYQKGGIQCKKKELENFLKKYTNIGCI